MMDEQNSVKNYYEQSPAGEVGEAGRGRKPGPEGFDDLRKAGVDYAYNADDWETTYDVSDQCFVDEALEDAGRDAVMTVSTLIAGPTLYAVRLVSERDDDGEPMDHEVRYFASYADAQAAIAKARGQ